jgi:hypothetical protein
MKVPSIACAVLLLVMCGAFAGCSKRSPADRSAPAGSPPAAEPRTEAAPAPQPEGGAAAAGEVQLAGVLGCGHCTYHVTPECAAVIKTASGDLYVIDGVQEGSELWEKRLDGNRQVAVTGTVVAAEPGTEKARHVAMTSFEFK